MPNKITTDGVVLKETSIGESDRVVTILSRELGIIRAFVTGAKKVGSKNSAATSLLCYGTYSVYKTKDAYRVSESEPKEMFFELRQDIEKLAVAQYISELCVFMAPQEENAEVFLRLVLNSFYFLASGKMNVKLIKSVTELRFLSVSGYMPDFVACSQCGAYESDAMYFYINEGNIVCSDCCTEPPANCAKLDKTVIAAVRHILYCEFKKLYSFSLPENYIDYLSKVSEKYILSQTEHSFKTLKFLHSLNL